LNILIIAKYSPSTFHAGGLRLLDLSRHLRKIYPSARLDLLSTKVMLDQTLFKVLPEIFDNILFCEHEKLIRHYVIGECHNLLRSYDIIDLQFTQDSNSLSALNQHCTKLLYTPMECATRALRIATTRFKKNLFVFLPSLISDAAYEIRFCRAASEVITVSEDDAAYLKSIGVKNVRSLPTSISDYVFPVDSNELENEMKENDYVLFFAYFGSYTNVQALEWYLKNVHGQVAIIKQNYKLIIVGAGDLSFVEKYAKNNIELIGEVVDPLDWIRKSKIGLALAQSGAGFRGKILQYTVGGIPTIANELAVGGMGFIDGRDILITDDPVMFAENVLRLLDSPHERERITKNAKVVLNTHHTWESKYDLIRDIYSISSVI